MRLPVVDRPRTEESGFTIVELLIYLLVSVIVITAVYQLLIGQNRLYSKQRELSDVRGTLRATATLLAWELRQASAADGDIYSMGPNSVALRSVQGTGVICGEHKTVLRYGVWGTSGQFDDTADDSAVVYAAGASAPGNDVWRLVEIVDVLTPTGGAVSKCFWGDSAVGNGKGTNTGSNTDWSGTVTPDLVLEVSGDMSDVYIGAPVRTFRKVEYGLYADDGRWWLGRKVGSDASYEKVAGPLRSPSDSGLVFVWYNEDEVETAAIDSVRLVDVILRGESLKAASSMSGGDATVQQDTLTLRVTLRG